METKKNNLQAMSSATEEIVSDPTGICCTAYPKCIHESAQYTHEVIHGKCNQYIDELKADRDKLAQEVVDLQKRCDLNETHILNLQSRAERAEKQARELADVLKMIRKTIVELCDSGWKSEINMMNEALAAYQSREK